jgi:phospholipase C
MSLQRFASHAYRSLRVALASVALFQFTFGASLAGAAPPPTPPNSNSQSGSKSNDNVTTSPVKHVIVIIGENRSYDHVFATYVPKHGQFTWNLLFEGIVKSDGTPGPNFSKVTQTAASDAAPDAFLLSPDKVPFSKNVLPAPLVGGPSIAGTPTVSYVPNPCAAGTTETACAQSVADATASENGLLPSDIPLLLTGGTTLAHKIPDTRITNVTGLPPGPFQITNRNSFGYDDYAASPVHRFYQMWQQLDCNLQHANFFNPSGCDARLFSWVEVATGAGAANELNGLPQPTNFSTEYAPGDVTTGEGSTSMAFYNVQQGDVPYFKSLADNFAMSDNFHQSVDGGTGANHIMFGHGDMIFYSDEHGNPLPPPSGVSTGGTTPAGTPTVLDEVENPNPYPSTNNWYTEDGYGDGSLGGAPAYGGGSYSECANTSAPGVAAIANYLKGLRIDPRCQPGHYYLLNNYNPGYFGQGEDASKDTTIFNTVFTIPPSSVPSIGDDLLANNISWKYYGDDWNAYAGNAALNIPEDKYQIDFGPVGAENEAGTGTIEISDEYCTICNPFQYDTSIMTNTAIRQAHIQDTANLYNDITAGTLPAVSVVKPSGLVDGHPSSSKLDLFEAFTKKIVTMVQASKYWQDTAIFITFDEGGGYYDSGYVQPLDFFGDGTRIPLIVVSPYATGGFVSHEYSDHVSILKFIERNWKLPPVTNRSRDNFPNPSSLPINPYVPLNSPAISDLFDLFDFGQHGFGFGLPGPERGRE